MPRNRSEKLPSCPEAIAYADAVEKWLAQDNPRPANLGWRSIPTKVRDEIARGAPRTASRPLAFGRRQRMNYIRKTYAA